MPEAEPVHARGTVTDHATGEAIRAAVARSVIGDESDALLIRLVHVVVEHEPTARRTVVHEHGPAVQISIFGNAQRTPASCDDRVLDHELGRLTFEPSRTARLAEHNAPGPANGSTRVPVTGVAGQVPLGWCAPSRANNDEFTSRAWLVSRLRNSGVHMLRHHTRARRP
jgi:hypothetical protein